MQKFLCSLGLVFVSSLAGCGSDGGGVALRSDVTLETLAGEFAAKQCAYLERCFGPAATALVVGVDCVGERTRQFEDATLPGMEAAVAGGSTAFDGAAARRCLNASTAVDCGTSILSASEDCDAAFVGTVAEGDACSISEECSGAATCDTSEAQCPGACKARKAVGAACAAGDRCVGEASCVEGACVARAGLNEPCGPGVADCGGLAACVRTGDDSGRCQLQTSVSGTGALDAACTRGALCGNGLVCKWESVADDGSLEGTCFAAVPAGSACWPSVPEACPPGQWCDFGDTPPNPGAAGQCVDVPASDGEACATAFELCGAGLSCVDSVCRTIQRIGGACAGPGECYSGRCVAGACAAPVCGSE